MWFQSSADKLNKQLESQLSELNNKLDATQLFSCPFHFPSSPRLVYHTDHPPVWLQSSADKLNKQLESQLSELNNKLDVTQRELNDVTAAKNHAQSDVTDLSRQLEEAENEVSQLSRAKQALTKKFDEAKSTADNEAQAKSKLSAELRNAQVLSCLVFSHLRSASLRQPLLLSSQNVPLSQIFPFLPRDAMHPRY